MLGDLVKDTAKDFVDSGIKSLLGGFGGTSGPKEGFSVQNVVASLQKSGLANSSHFEVQCTGPRTLQVPKEEAMMDGDFYTQTSTGLSDVQENEMMYRAESCELPGRSLATVDHRFDNYSPISRVVTGQTYVDSSITFLLSEDLREKEYFERWQDAAVGTGAFAKGSANEAKNNPAYHDQYVGTVTIRQYGADGTLRSVHKLEKAFPIVLGGVQMSWSSDEHARLAVSFSYNRYTAVFYKQNQAEKGISAGFSLGPGGLAGSLQVPGIGSFNVGGGRTSVNLDGVNKKVFSAIGF